MTIAILFVASCLIVLAGWRIFVDLSATGRGDEMNEWLRWQIALWMDRWPDICWGRLALWALFPELHEFWEILEMHGTAGRCARHGESPYCGKCGRMLFLPRMRNAK